MFTVFFDHVNWLKVYIAYDIYATNKKKSQFFLKDLFEASRSRTRFRLYSIYNLKQTFCKAFDRLKWFEVYIA